ncbi:unnamed protein product [Alopecurus aequalis]
MKIFFLLALFSLVVSGTFAQYTEFGDIYDEVEGAPGQCQQHQMKLESCREYVAERCTTMKDFPITWPWKWWKGGCWELRNECCQLLGQMPSECRCDAIWRSIQGELGGFLGIQRGLIGKRLQIAKSLPSQCNMGPQCNIPMFDGYYR